MAKSGGITGMYLCDHFTVRKLDHQQIWGFLYQYVSHAHWWQDLETRATLYDPAVGQQKRLNLRFLDPMQYIPFSCCFSIVFVAYNKAVQ